MLGAARDETRPLLGRDAELSALQTLIDGVHVGGGALVLRGEPGIGKSRLLAETTARAREAGFRVLSTTGVQSEARLGFAGLHQLLRPERARVTDLPPSQRAALDAAFGLSDDDAPEPFRIAMAVLDLLSETASDLPVLAVVEDAHWLDAPSAEVLGFVARRVESDPIILLAATRDGYRSALGDAGLPELRLAPLDPADAERLLEDRAPDLSTAVRGEILREASGNPLALIELPVASRRDDGPDELDAIPLTDRLERAFAQRAADLPETTRLLLLAAALSDADDVAEILAAGAEASGSPVTLDDLAPAADAGIVDLGVRTVRFRHPLVRSAVRQSAPVAQRRRVHEALADALAADPDRRVWHRAALLAGVHEDVAAELEAAAARARRRGAAGPAFSAWRRAAELSAPDQRGRRLLAAAQLGQELGRPDVVGPLLDEVDRLEPTRVDRARATWIAEVAMPRALRDGRRAMALIDAAEAAGEDGDDDLRIDLLWLVAQRSWWADPGRDARRMLIDAAARLGGADAPDPRILAIHAYADPLAHAPGVIARLQHATLERRRDVEAARHLGPASMVAGAAGLGAHVLDEAVDGLRLEGRLGHLPRMLALQGMVAAWMARWNVAVPAAEEARRLSIELGIPLWVAGVDTVDAMIGGMRGDEDAAEQRAAAAERHGLTNGADFIVAMAQLGRIAGRLGAGRHAEAFEAGRRFFTAGDPAHHVPIGSWAIADVAEAGLHAGRADEAGELVAHVAAAAGPDPGDWIALGLRHASALLAEDEDEASGRFADALAADLGPWPYQRARLLLAHGRRLRRQRRVAESRAPLREARDRFDDLGCLAWSEQARRELRASGETSRHRTPDARDQLTAQELQIAQLAADGLSNREIGERLYLSHRTVGTHLYRIFPKLGITARGELTAALGPPARAAAAGT
jgi:DNA-binding CsgD family transcriptional regulator